MIKLLWKDMIIVRNKNIYLLGIILIIIGIMFGFEILNFKIYITIILSHNLKLLFQTGI